jgi:hypothetical protein
MWGHWPLHELWAPLWGEGEDKTFWMIVMYLDLLAPYQGAARGEHP